MDANGRLDTVVPLNDMSGCASAQRTRRQAPCHLTKLLLDVQRRDIDEQGAFYIKSTGPSSRPRHTLKHGDSFVVCDSHGDIGASAGGPDGLFNHDTRFLSHLELLINGMQPLLLGSSVRDDNVSLSVDLTNPDIYRDGHIVLARDTIHIVRTMYIWGDVAHQRIHVSNHGESAIEFTISLSFGCDFSDLFEARGMPRAKRGTHAADDDRWRQDRRAPIAASTTRRGARTSASTRSRSGVTETRLYLQRRAGQRRDRRPSSSRPPASAKRTPKSMTFFKGFMDANRYEKAVTRNVATVESSNEIFNEVMCRSTADLYMLITDTPQGPYPYAGTPWYSTTFGRDGIITALQMLWLDPTVARGVLNRLAQLQATGLRCARRTPNPARSCTRCAAAKWRRCSEVPFGLYYGTIDATPLFIVLAGEYLKRTGDLAFIRDLWPAIDRALGMDGRVGRSRRRRLPRIFPRDGCRPAESGLEGLVRFGVSCRRPHWPKVRSRWWRCRPMPMRRSAWRRLCARRLGFADRATLLDKQATRSRRTVRRGLLVRGDRHLRDRARRREEALPRANVEWRPGAVDRHRPAGPGQDHGRRTGVAGLLLRLGHSARWRRGSRATIPCRTTTARSGRTTTA